MMGRRWVEAFIQGHHSRERIRRNIFDSVHKKRDRCCSGMRQPASSQILQNMALDEANQKSLDMSIWN